MKLTYLSFIIACIVLLGSCEKEAGEGGSATITGKVFVRDYNSSFTTLNREYFAPDEDVYIIYGDDPSYGDRVRTSFDGSYMFKYLREGKYKIYVYSDDSTGQSPSGVVPVIREIEIKSRNEKVEVPQITILK